MSEPMRFRVADNQAQRTLGGNIMEVHPDGPYVLFGDYSRLKAEVERLTKAGDLMCRMAGNNQVINRHWKTAKKGVQS